MVLFFFSFLCVERGPLPVAFFAPLPPKCPSLPGLARMGANSSAISAGAWHLGGRRRCLKKKVDHGGEDKITEIGRDLEWVGGFWIWKIFGVCGLPVDWWVSAANNACGRHRATAHQMKYARRRCPPSYKRVSL